MKKYYSYISTMLYVLALILYVASMIFEKNRAIFMCFGSCALAFGALLTINANKNNKE